MASTFTLFPARVPLHTLTETRLFAEAGLPFEQAFVNGPATEGDDILNLGDGVDHPCLLVD